jgi:hypothetical protein
LVTYFEALRGLTDYAAAERVQLTWILFRVGAETSAVAGALAGGLFAALLVLRDHRKQFEQLTLTRVGTYGAVGGFVVGASTILFMTTALGRPVSSFLPLAAIATLLGVGSAMTMLQWVRRSLASSPRAFVADSEESARLVNAQAEVELLLAARDNLTTLAADGRSEGLGLAGRPR